MKASAIEIIASVLFVLAIAHTFSVAYFRRIATRFPEGSITENVFHLLGEVEIVFGLWAALLFLFYLILKGPPAAISWIESCRFTEPAFVFVVMSVASTKPVLEFAGAAIQRSANLLPLPPGPAFFLVALGLGPLLGSLITEPAAMTVVALLMRDRLFLPQVPQKLRYAALGLLFVNISIGGVLTHFAAPPVLMVAQTWNWDSLFMFKHFGWKAAIAVAINAIFFIGIFWSELKQLPVFEEKPATTVPLWLQLTHLVFLLLIVLTAHHAVIFFGIFLFFIGLVTSTKEYQSVLILRGGLLVGFFLAGLVVLGSLQTWWLSPLIQRLSAPSLFLAATALTAFNDNAAITYLGSLVPNVSEAFRYALVAGAVVGGGLTVIANAPNPAGFLILEERFPGGGINPLKLFLAALPPTVIAMLCFWFLPHL